MMVLVMTLAVVAALFAEVVNVNNKIREKLQKRADFLIFIKFCHRKQGKMTCQSRFSQSLEPKFKQALAIRSYIYQNP